MRVSFSSREEAGRLLAERLITLKAARPRVLGVSRGGVAVAAPVAAALDAPLDVLVVRRIAAPWTPEVALGAVAENGALYLDPRSAFSELDDDPLDLLVSLRRQELRRLSQRYRQGRRLEPADGAAIVLVDDGIASGVTARAAIASARRLDPSRLVLAVPVCHPERVPELTPLVDALFTLEQADFGASVEACFPSSRRPSEQEVVAILEDARSRHGGRRMSPGPEAVLRVR